MEIPATHVARASATWIGWNLFIFKLSSQSTGLSKFSLIVFCPSRAAASLIALPYVKMSQSSGKLRRAFAKAKSCFTDEPNDNTVTSVHDQRAAPTPNSRVIPIGAAETTSRVPVSAPTSSVEASSSTKVAPNNTNAANTAAVEAAIKPAEATPNPRTASPAQNDAHDNVEDKDKARADEDLEQLRAP